MGKTILATILNLITEKETILFCGSGVSYNSGIPTVVPFIQYLLQKLEVKEEHIEVLIKSKLPFEVAMEVLSEFVDVKPLLNAFNIENPNLNHYLIATLFREHCINIIITTNFDRNIELALNHIGLFEGLHFELLSDAKSIASFKYEDNKKYLIKLHGSIENKDSLLTFIERIATNANQSTVLDFLTSLYATNKRNILFCGYSFSDAFDINPAFEITNKSSKTSFAIEHQSRDIPEQIESSNNVEILGKGFTLKCNFDKLVSELAPAFNVHTFKHPAIADWKSYVDQWMNTVLNGNGNDKGLNDKNILSLNLFFKIKNYSVVGYYLQRCFRQNFSYKHRLFKMEILFKKGACDMDAGKATGNSMLYASAIKSYEAAIELAKSSNDQFNIALYSGAIAQCFMLLRNYIKAQSFLLGCIEFFRSRVNDPNEPHPESAKKHYVGYIFSLAACYRTGGDFQKALPFYRQALELSSEYGHLETRTLALYGIGLLYQDIKNYEESLDSFLKAYDFAKKLQISDRITNCFVQICSLINIIRGYEAAKLFYDREIIFIGRFRAGFPSLDEVLLNMENNRNNVNG